MHMLPVGHGHLLPLSECFQAPFEHPFGLVFLVGYETNDVLVQSRGDGVGFEIGYEPGFISAIDDQVFDILLRCGHNASFSRKKAVTWYKYNANRTRLGAFEFTVSPYPLWLELGDDSLREQGRKRIDIHQTAGYLLSSRNAQRG